MNFGIFVWIMEFPRFLIVPNCFRTILNEKKNLSSLKIEVPVIYIVVYTLIFKKIYFYNAIRRKVSLYIYHFVT